MYLGGLNLPRNDVVKITDRSDMTIVAYHEHKATN